MTYWKYYPNTFPKSWFDPLHEEIVNKVTPYINVVNGKEYESKRLSCFFTDTDLEKKHGEPQSPYFSYHKLPLFDWSGSEMISKIRFNVQLILKEKYDYCLVHIYKNGKATINYHCDNEALDTDICSVSFGQSRKFRLRKMGETKGYEAEFLLNSGDMFHMLPGCQRLYKHCVPVESTAKEARINLTFRKLSE